MMIEATEKDKRLGQLVDLMVKYTSLDFSEKAFISEQGDEIDAFAAGLNTMAEELQYSLEKIKRQAVEIRTMNEYLELKVKERTAELAESKKKYRDLFEYNPLPMWIIDAATFQFLRVNDSAVREYGYSTKEFLSMTALDIRPEEEKKKFLSLSRSGDSVPYNTGIWKHLKKDGTVLQVEVNVSAVVFEDRNARLVLVNNVTEREEVKKRLEAALQRSKHAQAIAHVGHWEVDLTAWKSFWSDEAFRIYGIEPGTAEASYELFLKSIHPDDFQMVKAITDKSMQDFKPFYYHHRIVTPAGKVKYILAAGEYELDAAGKPARLFGIAMDVTELKEKEQKLIQSETQLRNFANHLNKVQEEERTHIAREIHDELGQQLAGMKMNLSQLAKNTDISQVSTKAKEMISDVDSTIQTMRKISTSLRPGILDSLGLIPSLEWLAKEFERKTNIKCSFVSQVKERPLDKNISTCFFRICQEALTNISKHAGADKVIIRVSQNKNELTLTVTDNGSGMSDKKLKNPFSMGLLGMRERANNIGGDLQITSKKNKGTAVRLKASVK